MLAHHDAAPSGYVFDPSVTEWLADRRPDIVEAMKSNPPLWWPVIAGPALTALGSVTGSRALRWLGLFAALGSLAAMVDIGRRPAVPGANDNLSGVAVLVALAEALSRNPVSGLRVLLVSAGAEEALQEGIRGFARNHFGRLPAASTWFLNVDTVGSGRLVLLEGEGTVRMHDYDSDFKDFVSQVRRRKRHPASAWSPVAQQHRRVGPAPARISHGDGGLGRQPQTDAALPSRLGPARTRRLRLRRQRRTAGRVRRPCPRRRIARCDRPRSRACRIGDGMYCSRPTPGTE